MDKETYEDRLQELKASAAEFGKTLIAWRGVNGWTQYTIDKWAEDAQFKYPSYGNLSVIENGKNLNPRPTTFIQFGDLNQRIASISQQALLKIKDKDLRQIIKKSKPIETFYCGTWDAQHFFMHFIGLLPRPSYLEDHLQITKEAKEAPIANSQVEAFMMLSPNRFSLINTQILTPEKMTAKELKIIDYLCSVHGYLV